MEDNKTKNKNRESADKPMEIYPVIDTDLGRDNLENDISAADLQDM